MRFRSLLRRAVLGALVPVGAACTMLGGGSKASGPWMVPTANPGPGNGANGGNGGNTPAGNPPDPNDPSAADPNKNVDYGDGSGGTSPSVPFGEPADKVSLEYRSGPETNWLSSFGSLAGYSASNGSLTQAFGPVIIETSVPGSHVSTVPGSPNPDMRQDCGAGCTLAVEESLVFRPPGADPGDNGTVTIVSGHTQLRWGWSPGGKAWVPQAYGYANLGALDKDDKVIEGKKPADFAAAVTWVVWQRNLAYAVFSKFASGVFRITERNDAMASMDKRNAQVKPPPMFMRGRTTQYVRTGPEGILTKILDYRQPALEAIVIDRADGPEGAGTGRVTGVHIDVADGSATQHFKLGYEDDPVSPGTACSAEGVCLGLDMVCQNHVATFDSNCGDNGGTRLNSVSRDANDPAGNDFRNPTFITYADSTSARFDSIVDPFGDPLVFTWTADGRLASQKHNGPTAKQKAELRFVYDCGGPCSAGAAPTTVTEIDEDGYALRTTFARFPDGNDKDVYVSEKARGNADANDAVTIDEASRVLFKRDATGYLVRQYNVGERTLRAWNTDGMPARHARVVRTDENVDISAFDGSLPPRSVAGGDYEIAFFDGDNQVVRTLGPEGIRTYVYQKALHANDGYAWAAGLPLRITTQRKGADPAATADEITTEEVTVLSPSDAANANDPPAVGTPCAFNGECVGLDAKCQNGTVIFDSNCGAQTTSECADLYGGSYSFLVSVQETMAGGPQCVWLDDHMRPVASLNPGDGSLPSTTTYHSVYGLPETRSIPSASMSTTKAYGAGGYVSTETRTTCGAQTYTRAYTLNKTENKLVETVGTGPPVTTINRLNPGSGLSTRIDITASGYAKSSTFGYAPNSSAMVRRTDTYTPTGGGSPVTENFSWYVRGYGGP